MIRTILLLALVGCAWDHIDPSATKPLPDAPCGNLGVPCMNAAGNFNHTCCWEGETCGGGPTSIGCPSDACCNVRMPPAFLKYDSGIREEDASPVVIVKHPQTRP